MKSHLLAKVGLFAALGVATAWAQLVLGLACLAAGEATAQQLPPQPGTVVQLPTFSFFGGLTTVVVPDRGATYLGGVNRAASGRNEFGAPLLPFRPFRNTAIGTERSASNMWVTAWIHDFEAMDEYLLSQPTAGQPGRLGQPAWTGQPPWQGRGWLGQSEAMPQRASETVAVGQTPALTMAEGNSWSLALPPSSAGRPVASVTAEQARRTELKKTRSDEAAQLLQLGRRAEAAGNLGAARVYYQMAARQANGPLKAEVAARLAAISGAKGPASVAQTRP